MASYKLLIKSAKQIVQGTNNGARLLCGADMSRVAVLESKTEQGFSIVVDNDGKIVDIDTDAEILKRYKENTFHKVIEANGKSIIPGLVDAHTHPVWAGDRVHEFEMKLAGATYMEVHNAGGGIHFTVDHTREASEETLYGLLKTRIQAMVAAGTTLVECKSGYGLDTETEVKMLKVINRLKQRGGIDVSVTYCGAHAVPRGKTPEEATTDILEQQLPVIQKMAERNELTVDNIDVFCEKGVFDVEQSREILTAGKKLGLNINFHGDELNPLKSAEMGSEMGALAISHLEEVSDEGMRAMARSKSVAVILPTTAYILRLKPPPVRQMINYGVPVALGSDLNPNAYCLSMPLVMHLACVNLRMSMTEALCAATINSAASLGLSESHGSIEVGKWANLVILDSSKWQDIIYRLGCHNEIINTVVWHGEIVHSKRT